MLRYLANAKKMQKMSRPEQDLNLRPRKDKMTYSRLIRSIVLVYLESVVDTYMQLSDCVTDLTQ
jgi:hypothetical protein